jgi:hypothetical protein
VPAPTPPVIPEPFAQSGDRATIPDISGVTGRADWRVGFPAITMEAKIAGGIPPDGRDFNGIYWSISSHAFYAQGGQPYKYSTDISTAIGTYALGAMIGSADAKTLWYNNVNDNAADPDTDSSGWVSAFTYGSITISGLTGGTRTLTRLESRFGLIVLTGALASNQAVVLPNDKTEWRIVNSCTGAFTVTARTASGTGVVVPQGDFSTSTEVYSNGTDIFFSVPPISLPIAVTPTPNTLIMRDNVGDGFARYFNGNTSAEAVTVANVLVTNNANGYFRKISFSDFLLQTFADAALTGVPTAPTPPPGDSSKKIVTTDFLTTSQTLAVNGHATLFGGLIFQWGSVHVGNLPPSPTPAIVAITFPVAFTTIFQVFGTLSDPLHGVGGVFSPVKSTQSNTGAEWYINELNSGVQDVTLNWFALGV